MNISIVIPNYNGEKILEKNLPGVLKIIADYQEGEKEIVFIDDASIDKSISVVTSLFKDFNPTIFSTKIISNSSNLGFAPTVNKGVSQAVGEVIILLNTDVIPENNFLKPLLRPFSDESVFAVGCLEINKDAKGEKTYGRGLGKWEKGFLVHRAGEIKKTNTLWVSGGSGAFRRAIWHTLGGFNEIYTPFYWEDIDICYRALKSGYSLIFEAKSVVIHEHQKGAIKTFNSDYKIRKIAYRNQILFVWNNITSPIMLLQHIFWLPYHMGKAILHMDWAYPAGLIAAIGKLKNVFLTRFRNKGKFIKSDFDVIIENNQ